MKHLSIHDFRDHCITLCGHYRYRHDKVYLQVLDMLINSLDDTHFLILLCRLRADYAQHHVIATSHK